MNLPVLLRPRPRIGSRLVAVFAVLSLLASLAATASPLHLVLFHTGDIHGRIAPYPDSAAAGDPKPMIGGYATLKSVLTKARLETLPRGGLSLWLDTGDFFQGTPVVMETEGSCMIDLMNRVGCFAATLGNHEVDHTPKVLYERMRAAKFPFTVCNVFASGTDRIMGNARPSIIVPFKGYKIAFIGFLTPETVHMTFQRNLEGLEFRDPKPILQKLVPDVRRRGADLVVLLSHRGIEYDRELARDLPGVDLILGGHSHTQMQTAYRDETTGVVVSHSGTALKQVNRVDIRMPAKGEKPTIAFEAITLSPASFTPDPEIAAVVASYVASTDKVMKQVIAETKVTLIPGIPGGDSPLGNLICDSLREHSQTDFAFMNFGGIRLPIYKGPITREDVFMLQPFDNTVEVVTMTGAEVRKLFEKSFNARYVPMMAADKEYAQRVYFVEASGVTRDFHGASGYLLPGNLNITYDPQLPAGQRITTITDDAGTPLEASRTYTVAMSNFIADGGDGFEELRKFKQRKSLPILVRDVFQQYLIKRKVIEALPKPRIANKGLTVRMLPETGSGR